MVTKGLTSGHGSHRSNRKKSHKNKSLQSISLARPEFDPRANHFCKIVCIANLEQQPCHSSSLKLTDHGAQDREYGQDYDVQMQHLRLSLARSDMIASQSPSSSQAVLSRI